MSAGRAWRRARRSRAAGGGRAPRAGLRSPPGPGDRSGWQLRDSPQTAHPCPRACRCRPTRPVAGKARWRRPRDRASRSPRWRRPWHRPCRRRTRDGGVRARTARTRPACRRSGTVPAGTAPPLPPAATAQPCREGPAPPPTQAPPEVLPAEAQRPPARADCQRPRAPQYRPQPAPISRSWKATPNQTEYRTFGQTRDHSTRRCSRRLYIRGARRHTVREGGPGSMR